MMFAAETVPPKLVSDAEHVVPQFPIVAVPPPSDAFAAPAGCVAGAAVDGLASDGV